MNEVVRLNPGVTLSGSIREMLKKPGDVIHFEADKANYITLMNAVTRLNTKLRLMGEIGKFEQRYKSSKELKEGYISALRIS